MLVISKKNRLPENCHFCEFRYMRADGFHACGICHAIISKHVNNDTKYKECPIIWRNEYEKSVLKHNRRSN